MNLLRFASYNTSRPRISTRSSTSTRSNASRWRQLLMSFRNGDYSKRFVCGCFASRAILLNDKRPWRLTTPLLSTCGMLSKTTRTVSSFSTWCWEEIYDVRPEDILRWHTPINSSRLSVHLERLGSLPENTVRFYIAEIASALSFLHQHRIMHRLVQSLLIMTLSHGTSPEI